MNNVNFNNCHSEDCLNVTKSKINLKNIKFSDAKSDGIDLDFVDGKIKNFQINKIKGDGVDVSGSNLIIENMNIKNIQDKCISIGEDSFTELINIDLENCKFGLVIKDSGSSKVKNIKINNVEDYDVAIYKKKTFYDNPLEVKIGNIKSKNKFFSQKDTSLEIDNTRIKNTILSTKKINQIF